MQSFTIAPTPHLVFGTESITQLGLSIRSRGGHTAAIVVGRSLLRDAEFAAGLSAHLGESGVAALFYRWDCPPAEEPVAFLREVDELRALADAVTRSDGEVSEPSPDIVDAIAASLPEAPDVVVAIGGGSAVDTGKALSAAIVMQGSIADYLEGVGSKEPTGTKVPFIAVPTTAGTGAEATKNAVLARRGPDGFKKSLRHHRYVPDVAIIDPQLALGCPASVTGASGLDALTQLLEAYVSTKANPYTDSLALTGLEHLGRSFLRAVERGTTDVDARAGMAFAAYLSGVCLANAGLGTVHGLAGVAGALAPVPHGAFCARLLGPTVKQTIAALTRRRDALGALGKYAAAAQALTGRSGGSLEEKHALLIARIEEYVRVAEIPSLSHYSLTEDLVTEIAAHGSNKNNPYLFEQAEREALLRAAL
ncbi:MAG: iron-containing alcohol dehydrogenase [Spirochaetota bacterium]